VKKRKALITILIFIFIIFECTIYTEAVSEKKSKMIICLPIIPKKGTYVSSDYGYRIHPITKEKTMHYGIDIAAPVGTYVHAIADGEIIMARGNGTAGNEIKIKHKNGIETRYLHMDKKTVKVGDKVKVGQIIGTVGDTGRVTGAHLHFEVIINGEHINPAKIYN